MFVHIDADSFFASVLIRRHPALRGKPVLALGMGGGCIIAASYEAKAKGVRTGMRLREAMRLVPNAVSMPSDFQETAIASRQIESILSEVFPIVERMSVDEWYGDLSSIVGGTPSHVSAWAMTLRKDILRRTSLSVSIGIAASKTLAKMAGDYRKPGGITIIVEASNAHEPHGVLREAFLKERPAMAIPGIGRKRGIHTESRAWHSAWDIAVAEEHEITALFGRIGRDIQRELLGTAVSPVRKDDRPPKSVSRCRSFPKTKNRDMLYAHMLRHLEYLTMKMRRHGLGCLGLSAWLRNEKYEHKCINVPLTRISCTEDQLRPEVQKMFDTLYQNDHSYTQAGLALWGLKQSGESQLSLFESPKDSLRAESVQRALDALHSRFGRESITHASALMAKATTQTLRREPEGAL